ncbi:MAG: hypothetical protein Q7U66_15775 [Methylobacter sp.]|nr:hypothetical protein [Methylobacter sp.]
MPETASSADRKLQTDWHTLSVEEALWAQASDSTGLSRKTATSCLVFAVIPVYPGADSRGYLGRYYRRFNRRCSDSCGCVTIQPQIAQMHADKLKYKELTRLIVKSFYQVYKELGGGFLESACFPVPTRCVTAIKLRI